MAETKAPCSSGINTFSSNEGLEASGGGWISGGVGNDWIWDTISNPVISAAGEGTRCLIIGGLTGSSYTMQKLHGCNVLVLILPIFSIHILNSTCLGKWNSSSMVEAFSIALTTATPGYMLAQ